MGNYISFYFILAVLHQNHPIYAVLFHSLSTERRRAHGQHC